MDVWEKLVQEYLCLDRHLFLNAQYNIGRNIWHARLDFLALDFGTRTVWMVEVSKSKGNLYGKTSQFLTEYKPRIERQLADCKTLVDASWCYKLWLFCSDIHHPKLTAHMNQCGVEGKVTSLGELAAKTLSGEARAERRDYIPERLLLSDDQ